MRPARCIVPVIHCMHRVIAHACFDVQEMDNVLEQHRIQLTEAASKVTHASSIKMRLLV